MKRICIVFLVLLSLQATAQRYRPSDFTFSYLTDLCGVTDIEEVEDSMRQVLYAYSFSTPDSYLNALGGLLSVAESREREEPLICQLRRLQYGATRRRTQKLWRPMVNHLKAMPEALLSTRVQAERYEICRIAASMASYIGVNAMSFQTDAAQAQTMLNLPLWMDAEGHWAGFKDAEGLRRQHPYAPVAVHCAPVNAEACSPSQAYRAMRYVDSQPMQDHELFTAALANFKAGRNGRGYQLLKEGLRRQLYDGLSPVDSVAMASRTLTEGLFGIQARSLDGVCIIRPGFPDDWDTASVHTPYLDYHYWRTGNDQLVLKVKQHFRRPLKIVLRINLGMGEYVDVEGTKQLSQEIHAKLPVRLPEIECYHSYENPDEGISGHMEPTFDRKFRKQRVERYFNDSIRFDMQPDFLLKDEYVVWGVPFRVALDGPNIATVSYPDTLSIPVSGQMEYAWLLMAGTTNDRELHISNGEVVARYADGTTDSLPLVNPDNWAPLAPGSAHRLCLPLRWWKKLVAIELHPQSNDVKIGLMGLTLQ